MHMRTRSIAHAYVILIVVNFKNVESEITLKFVDNTYCMTKNGGNIG